MSLIYILLIMCGIILLYYTAFSLTNKFTRVVIDLSWLFLCCAFAGMNYLAQPDDPIKIFNCILVALWLTTTIYDIYKFRKEKNENKINESKHSE